MKNYFRKFGIIIVMSLMLVFGCSITTFAADDGVVGTANLNNTSENSAEIGSQLKTPEKGWKRYDDLNKKILYNNSFNLTSDTAYYNSTRHTTIKAGDSLNFKFYGYKLRITGAMNTMDSNKIQITIDDHTYSYTANNTVFIPQCLIYENLQLGLSNHNVKITNLVNANCTIDAIDINDTGNLIDVNESIILDKSSMDMIEDDSQQLIAATTPSSIGVTWTSSDPSIATIEVDPTNGKLIKVNAIKEGTCIITATTADGSNLSSSCTINVTKKDVPKPDNPTTDTKTGAILIINLTDGETKVFDVSSAEVDKFKSWYNNRSEFENKLTYVFNKTVNSNVSVEEDVVHNQITSFEIRKY